MVAISQINSQLTKAYLTEKKENQYFERKVLVKKIPNLRKQLI